MRAPVKASFAGQTFRAVGSRLFWSKPTETDHEFYVRVLQSVFKPGWYKSEIKKPLAERHVVAKWYDAWCEWRKEQAKDENRVDGGWRAIPSGDTWSLLTLAYDLYCLMHCSSLPSALFKRLKQKKSFQGARYELAVASIFVRLDYKLEWIPEKTTKSCEFFATHKYSGEVVAVEAKSRHRSGVLHQPGIQEAPEELKIGITGLLNQALEQKPQNVPFVIFLDLNIPPTEGPPQDTAWWEDLKQAVVRQGEISETNPERYAALFVTNFSYHFEGRNLLNAGKDIANSGIVIPRFSDVPFKRLANLNDLIEGVKSYERIPRLDESPQNKDLAEQASFVNQLYRLLLPRRQNLAKRPPTITTILTCGNLMDNKGLLDFQQVGHTIFSRSGSGTVDLWIYVEGHWFEPGTIQVKIEIVDEQGKKVSSPPLIDATVAENGIFELKLLLEKHVPFRPGSYEVTASVQNGPSAATEIFMIA